MVKKRDRLDRRLEEAEGKLAAAAATGLRKEVSDDVDLSLVALCTDENVLDEMYDILETNMRSAYEATDWGWDASAQKAKLREKAARYILVKRNSKIAGFAHFRLEEDDEDIPERAVLYVHELQMAQNFRGKGFGTKIMRIIDIIAADLRLDAIMLTVFKANAQALRLYERIGFLTDRDDPTFFGDDSMTYTILSKRIITTASRSKRKDAAQKNDLTRTVPLESTRRKKAENGWKYEAERSRHTTAE